MSTLVLSPQLVQILEAASQLVDVTDSAALLLVVEQRLDWSRLRDLLSTQTVLIASDDESHLVGVTDHGMGRIMIDVTGLPVHERLTQAGVISDWREPNVIRVAPAPLYNSFEDVFEFVSRLKSIL